MELYKVEILCGGVFLLIVAGVSFILKEIDKMSVDLTAEFAKLDASIAALPARIAAQQANQIQPADVQAAADARAAQVDAIAPAQG